MVLSAILPGQLGLGSSLLNKPKAPTQVQPDQYNPYGEVNTPAEGAIDSRDSIFELLNSQGFQDQTNAANQGYIDYLSTASRSPQLAAIEGFGERTLRGDYLNSALIARYADQARDGVNRTAADSAERLSAGYGRAGQGFSTGQLQAVTNSKTRASSEAERLKAGILASNYQNERALQQSAPSILQGVANQRGDYLSRITGAEYQPLQLRANLTTGLLGGGNTVQQADAYQNPSTMDSISQGVSTASGLAELYNIYAGKKKTTTAPAFTAPSNPLNESVGGGAANNYGLSYV